MPNGVDENALSLAEFVKLPTTVEFFTLNTDRFKHFGYMTLGKKPMKSGHYWICGYWN